MCVRVCVRVTERVLGGRGCCSLDRLGGPASLHILSSSVVCWGSSDYWATLNTLSKTHTQFKNKGIYIQAHTQVKAMQMWGDNYIPTTHIHTHEHTSAWCAIFHFSFWTQQTQRHSNPYIIPFCYQTPNSGHINSLSHTHTHRLDWSKTTFKMLVSYWN